MMSVMGQVNRKLVIVMAQFIKSMKRTVRLVLSHYLYRLSHYRYRLPFLRRSEDWRSLYPENPAGPTRHWSLTK